MTAASKCAIVCGAGYVSGKEVMALQLAKGLAASGWEVEFIVSSWNDGDFASRLLLGRVPFCELPIGFISASLSWRYLRMTLEQAWRIPQLWSGYSRFLARFTPRLVVHSNWHHLLLLFPFLRPSRDVFWSHEIFPALPHYRRLFRVFQARVGSFICASEAVARSLLALGVAPGRVHVVRNGISDPSDPSVTPMRGRRSTLEPLQVGIVGQIGEWKGHADLIAAMGILIRKGIPLELTMFGRGAEPYVSELRSQIRENKLDGVVHWRGFVADRKDIYDALDVCVVPSRFEEPFGLTALEPAFFSRPVIATRRGGLPEIVRHEETGLLVDSESPQQIAAALLRLFEDDDLRVRLGRAARARAVEEFSGARFIAEFTDRLREVESRSVCW